MRPDLVLAGALLAVGLWQLGAGGYIQLKALLAQRLIAGAWAERLAGNELARPWPWADTWPIARLRVPARDIDLYVLEGGHGRALAFGPGHIEGTAAPGARGHAVIAGHRDTHFAFLRDLSPGTEMRVQRQDGQWQSYRVNQSAVLDARDAQFYTAEDSSALTLVTCYPFDAVTSGGPLRYLVFAEGEALDP